MRQKRTLWGLPLLSAALFVASACADQAEGERCDPKNGNSDCSSGLVCTVADKLSRIEPSKSALCCPPLGAPVTVDSCQVNRSNAQGTDDAGRRPDATSSVPVLDSSVKPTVDASLGRDARADAP